MATLVRSSPVAPALRFPPVFTASKWATVYDALWESVQKSRGKYLAKYPGADGPQHAPRLTNGEVVTVIMAWLAALGMNASRVRELFPLWGQFAAAAYAWDPKRNTFDTSAKRRDAFYPDVLLVELWRSLMTLAHDLDDAGVSSPRLDMDGRFSDIVFQGEVKASLVADGADAQFKIPVPACKGKDGKAHAPKCKRQMKTWPYLCEEFEKCAPVVVDDPVTVVKRKAQSGVQLALLVGALWLLFSNKRRPRRRRS